jgi:polysaccharide pyruvyl transferase CsaB
MSPNIVIAGYYGFRNAGDEAILAGMLADLRDEIPGGTFTVVSGDPSWTRSQYGVEAVAWEDIDGLVRAVEGGHLVIVGGGGLFHDYWGVQLADVLTTRHGGIAQYAAPIVLARALGVPSMLYAVGVGPLLSPEAERLVHDIAAQANALTVRDEESKRILGSLGLDADRIEVTADPAFSLSRLPSPPRLDEGLASYAHPLLGVCLRSWPFFAADEDWEGEIALGLKRWIEAEGGTIYLVPMQDGDSALTDDRTISKRVADRLPVGSRVLLAPEQLTPLERLGLLEACDVVVGMRLHSLVSAVKCGIPCVGIPYDQKVASLFQAGGLTDFCIPVQSGLGNLLSAGLADAYHRKPIVRKRLLAAGNESANAARRTARIAKSLLRSNQKTRLPGRWPESLIPSLAERLFNEQKARSSLEAALDAARQEAEGLRAELVSTSDRAEVQLRDRDERLSVLEAELRSEQTNASRVTTERDEAAKDLQTLRSTLGVRMLGRYWDLARRWLPPGSRRRLAFQKIRGFLRSTALDSPFGILPTLGGGEESRVSGEGESAEQEAGLSSLLAFSRHAGGSVSGPMVVLVSPTRLNDEGQRASSLALELASRACPVVFAYFRWPGAETSAQDHLRNIFQIPLDVLLSSVDSLVAMMEPVEVLLLIEFPFPGLFELLATANGAGWITIYDIADAWGEFFRVGQAPWFEAEFEDHLICSCDAVLAVSDPLADHARSVGRRDVTVIPNAVGPGLNETAGMAPIERGEITLGYFGYLSEAWFDWDLVGDLARLEPTWRIYLIGYGQAGRHKTPGNVTVLGKIPRGALGQHARQWDAAIIPFKRGPLSAAADPVKTYEYLSFGLPVVVSGANAPPGAEWLVRRVESAAEFAREVRALAAIRPAISEEAAAYARSSTWGRRVDLLMRSVSSGTPRVEAKRRLYGIAP